MRAFQTYSVTALDNGVSDSSANQAEGMGAGVVNNSMRAQTARMAAIFRGIAGAITLGGTGSAYTFTSPSGHALQSPLTAPLVIWAKANVSNTGAATLNPDAIGATAIKRQNGDDLEADDIVANGIYGFAFDGTQFRLLNREADGEISDAINAHVGAGDPHTQYVLTSEIGSAVQAYGAELDTWATKTPPSGTVVGTSDAQTLTNKTLTSPTLGGTVAGAPTWASAQNFPSGSQVNSSDILTAAAISSTVQGYDANTAKYNLSGTWTQVQTLPGAILSSDYPFLDIRDTDGGTNAKNWRLDAGSGQLTLWCATDDYGTFNQAFTIARSGATAGVTNFPAGLQSGGNAVLTTATGAQLGAANFFTQPQTIQTATFPYVQLYENGAAADAKYSRIMGNGGLVFDFVNDAYSASNAWLTVSRSGATPTGATFGCPVSIENADTTLSRLSAGQLGVEGKAALQHAGAYTSGQMVLSTSDPSGGSDGDVWAKYTP